MKAHAGLQVTLTQRRATLTLCDSANKNMLSVNRLRQLTQVWDEIAELDVADLGIASESPTIFAAGADIRELMALDSLSAQTYAQLGQALMQRIEDHPARVVALVSGPCFGGALDLCLACDEIWASKQAVFCHPGSRLGIMTGFGGTVRLPEKVDQRFARWMLVSGCRVSAEDALAVGLVARLFDSHEDMMDLWRGEWRLGCVPPSSGHG